jgi:hypothetical protein
MSTQLGSLVVSLEANMARFTSDMGRAAQQTEQAMGKINGAANLAKGALAALGVGVSVGAFAALVKGAIDAADSLRDMSMKTGIAVETLNGLGFAAGQAGGSLESMVAAAGKLNKSIVEAAGGNKDVGEVFSKLGISVRDASGHLKKADVVMAEVADKFKTFADGPEKTAIALRIFGKAGADMIPVLNDGGDAMRENIEYARKYSGMTQELSDAADNFNDSMGKLAIQQKSFGNAMATAVLPVLQAVANELLSASEQSDKFALAGNVVRTTLETFVVVGSEVAFTFTAIGREIGALAAQADALGVSFIDMAQGPAGIGKALLSSVVSGESSLAQFTAISDAVKADAAKARAEHDAFIAAVLDRTPKAAQSVTDGWDDGGPKKAAPMLSAKGDDPTKALLDGQLKAMEAAYAQERDIASFHEKFMQELRNQDIVDLQAYQAFKTASIEQGLASAIRTYDAEIAVLERARAAAAKATDRAEIDNKIKDKQALKEKARLDATQAGAMQTLSLSTAQSGLNKTMLEWGIQQDQSIAQMQFSNDLYGKTTLEVAKLTEARRIELDIEEKIRLAKEKGAITDESIARYRREAAAKSSVVNKIATQAAGLGIIRDQRSPDEVEQGKHANTLATLEAARAGELASVVKWNTAIELENARHEQVRVAMKQQAEQSILSIMSTSTDQVYGLLKQAGLQQTALGKAAFIASKALGVAQIILSTNVAAASALAPPPIGLGPLAGIPLAGIIKGMGYASAAMVAGLSIAEASAENGYDIPAGKNPVTQLHEKEMVLPKAQADVIRGLASNGGRGGGGITINHSPVFNIDSRADRTQAMAEMRQVAHQTNADLVDRLQRAGRI